MGPEFWVRHKARVQLCGAVLSPRHPQQGELNFSLQPSINIRSRALRSLAVGLSQQALVLLLLFDQGFVNMKLGSFS